MAKIAELYDLPTTWREEANFSFVLDKHGLILAICTEQRTAEDISLTLNRHDELFEAMTTQVG
jgi:hypothetical protein